jgi:hypothetical protein
MYVRRAEPLSYASSERCVVESKYAGMFIGAARCMGRGGIRACEECSMLYIVKGATRMSPNCCRSYGVYEGGSKKDA